MKINQELPIIGKWYKVTGKYKNGFIGECVGYKPESNLPVILEDMEFNGCACKVGEIKVYIKQPGGKRINEVYDN